MEQKPAHAFSPEPDDDLIICRCEEITKGEIRKAIHDGMFTLNMVKRYLRPGMGLCQGQTCGIHVRRIIAKELGIPLSQVGFSTPRSPARPVVMEEYGRDIFDLPKDPLSHKNGNTVTGQKGRFV